MCCRLVGASCPVAGVWGPAALVLVYEAACYVLPVGGGQLGASSCVLGNWEPAAVLLVGMGQLCTRWGSAAPGSCAAPGGGARQLLAPLQQGDDVLGLHARGVACHHVVHVSEVVRICDRERQLRR